MQYNKMNPVYRKIFMSLKKIDGFNKNFIEPKFELERIRAFAVRMKEGFATETPSHERLITCGETGILKQQRYGETAYIRF
ncbi:MAG: hypothetical protein VB071_00050 [Lawsonibacter sp.]|nr:hypothetical protein [Lawsonibacter sp.]